jgi:RNA polymerase sigma-70 factor (ECF subfamily)
MAATETDSSIPARPQVAFVTTSWSVVLTATRSDTTRARAALEHLCRIYWYPIYFFVRRQGHSTHDAQDLTQEFFAQLLEKHWLAQADRSRGRFRSFMLLVLKRFMTAAWRKANAQKRAGNLNPLPLPLDTAEIRYTHEPADNYSPDQAFEKRWALALLDTVLRDLGAEYDGDGNARLFEVRNPALRNPGLSLEHVRGRCARRRASVARTLPESPQGRSRANRRHTRGGG